MFSIKRYALAVMLLALASSCHQRAPKEPSFEVRVYPVGNQGFGYALYQGGKKVIDQPYIPVIQHLAPFRSREEAECVAQLVNGKLKSHLFPPSVTITELDSLRIHY